MQNICLLFAGLKGLDDSSTRTSVLRIPEVSQKLKEAQAILDETLSSDIRVDLFSYIQAPDVEFNSKPNLKSLAAAIVQIGLYERFTKFRNQPRFLVGPENRNSAMKVCAGLQTLYDFVLQSDFHKENTMIARYSHTTKLTGVKLEEYCALILSPEGSYQVLEIEQKNATKIIEELNFTYPLSQCIHLGPHYEFRLPDFQSAGIHLASMSSIEMDPILSSFWKSAI